MGKRHNWEYCNASHSGHGEMICTACRKEIEDGEYRVRETEDAYLPQHRECSKDDPQWAIRDKDREESRQEFEAFILAAREFRSRWKSFMDSDFDDYCHDNMKIAARETK